jgi:hypothetical protein
MPRNRVPRVDYALYSCRRKKSRGKACILFTSNRRRTVGNQIYELIPQLGKRNSVECSSVIFYNRRTQGDAPLKSR